MTEAQWLASYNETIRLLFRFVSHRTGGDRDLTEDVIQETYLRALNNWMTGVIPDKPLAWLKRVAKNILISHLRKIHWQNTEDMDLKECTAKIPLDQQEKTQRIFQAISTVKKKQAKVLEAFYFDSKSIKEIARDLAISERAVEGRLRRARLSIKDRLIKGSI